MSVSDAYDETMTMAADLARRCFPPVPGLTDRNRLARVIDFMQECMTTANRLPVNQPMVNLAFAYALLMNELAILAKDQVPF